MVLHYSSRLFLKRTPVIEKKRLSDSLLLANGLIQSTSECFTFVLCFLG